jgi:micrococcal nuclease
VLEWLDEPLPGGAARELRPVRIGWDDAMLRRSQWLALSLLLVAAELPAQETDCTVLRIIDGDTFVCDGGRRIRLLLVDTDERNQSVYADSALMLVERLMPAGSRVRLEFDVARFDRYRRVLAYVYADSLFVNREIVRRGMGHVVVFPPNVRSVDSMRAAADSARQEKLGIWSGSAFECTPADFRARRCGRSPPLSR